MVEVERSRSFRQPNEWISPRMYSHGAVNFSTRPRTKPDDVCYRCGDRCGGQHMAQTCKFREVTCHTCGERGHIARVCRSGSRTNHIRNNLLTKSLIKRNTCIM